MGFRISWLAAEGISKPDLLSALGFVDTGESDEANEAPFSAADLPGGWSIIWSNNFDWVSGDRVLMAARDRLAVGCRLHEGVMWSEAWAARQGELLWNVMHDGQKRPFDAVLTGTAPDGYATIRQRLLAEQQQEGGDDADVDFLFDVPIELAKLLTGFQHDLWELPGSGRPDWTSVEPA